MHVKIKRDGLLDRTVRLLTSEWGWPGVVLLVGGVVWFALIPSVQWLDYRGIPDSTEKAVALGVAMFGFAWLLAVALLQRGSLSRHSRRS